VIAQDRRSTTQSVTGVTESNWDRDVVVVGGCGRAGLPLGVAFANAGLRVAALDKDQQVVAEVMAGCFPFREADGDRQLEKALRSGRFLATADPAVVETAAVIIVVIGTPVDDHLNPNPDIVLDAICQLSSFLRKGQLVVLRSTVCAGVTASVERLFEPLGVEVAFCPERVAEGQAFVELSNLPQIVAARSSETIARASALFGCLADRIIEMTPEEAELAKLFTNAWRYVRFAAANQFFMIANDLGVDFERVREAVTLDYPRAADIPPAGFAAGPCLLKDTMQLAGFHQNDFTMGHAAMLVNEGLPVYLVRRVEARRPLAGLTVGILGMAFKAETDDIRSSLAYKLRRVLRLKAAEVLCTDPYVTVDPSLVAFETVLERADLIFIGAPHAIYRHSDLSGHDVVDIWNLLGEGVLT
jgi:UDP-N-acetyl-D-mannosaminuronic acid dehydrogenase